MLLCSLLGTPNIHSLLLLLFCLPNTTRLLKALSQKLTTKRINAKVVTKGNSRTKIQLAKVLNKILTKIKLILELKGVKLTKIKKGKSLINLKSNRKALKSLTKANSYIQ